MTIYMHEVLDARARAGDANAALAAAHLVGVVPGLPKDAPVLVMQRIDPPDAVAVLASRWVEQRR